MLSQSTHWSQRFPTCVSCSLCMSKVSQQEAPFCMPTTPVAAARKQTLKNCMSAFHGLTFYWLEVVTPPYQGSWETSAYHFNHKHPRWVRSYLCGPSEGYLVDLRMRRNCCSHCGPKSWHDVHHARRESHLGGNRDGVQRRRLGEPRLGEVPEWSGSLTWKLGPRFDNLSRARPSQPASGWDRVRPIPLFRVACLPQRASEQNGSCPL